MSLYEFKRGDYFHNVLKTHPRSEFFFYNGKTFYNSRVTLSGAFHGQVGHHSEGEVSLYELNVDRPADSLIYPFITKDGSRNSFATVSTSGFNTDFAYGDIVSGTYPLTSSVHRVRYEEGVTQRPRITALRSTLRNYSVLGTHFDYSSSARDLREDEINLYSIPSIFFGSSIKKGSVVLQYYLTGNLLAEARDLRENGALYQTLPVGSPGSGSVVGSVMYNEGFVFLTGTIDLSNSQYEENYIPGGSLEKPQWTHFGAHGTNNPTSSYIMAFSGTTHTNVLTMFAHAKSGDLFYSNNPTYLDFTGSAQAAASHENSSITFLQAPRPIKNIVSSSYYKTTEALEKTVYISKIGVYDKDKNLIGIAKLASPVRKRLNDEYTFKLKLDI